VSKRKLTAKQELFCSEYIIDLNASQAAIRAGYSPKGSNVTGSKLLATANIRKRIGELQQVRREKSDIDAQWVLNRLLDEADADMGDIFDSEGKAKNIHDWPLIWRKGLVSGMDITMDEDGRIDSVKVRTSDRIKRLELIGKHIDIRAFTDRQEITGAGGGPIEIDDRSDSELAKRMAFILRSGNDAT